MKKETIDKNSLAHTSWELQVSYSFCAKISAKSIFRREEVGNQRNTKEIVRMERGRNHRGRSMSGSSTYVGKHPAQNERFGVHGIPQRKKCAFDIPKMGEHEIRIPKLRIWVQGILYRYRGEEHKGDKGIHRGSIEKRSGKRPVIAVRPTGPIYG